MKFNKFFYEEYDDIFNYSSKIKQINKGYRLYFNKKLKQFEILNINKNYEQCFIFDYIFNINLHDLRFLKIENLSQILNFIENSNSHLIKNQEINFKNKTEFIFKDLNKLSNRSTNLKNIDINKIIGATKC